MQQTTSASMSIIPATHAHYVILPPPSVSVSASDHSLLCRLVVHHLLLLLNDEQNINEFHNDNHGKKSYPNPYL